MQRFEGFLVAAFVVKIPADRGKGLIIGGDGLKH